MDEHDKWIQMHMGGMSGDDIIASETESEAADILSDEEELTSGMLCGVAKYKTWITVEDEDIDRIETMAAELREHP